MSGEDDLIAHYFKPLATDPGARGLVDDAAVLAASGDDLVLTTDAIVEGVHYLPGDPPEAIARKALRVNLSDLAAKGARPLAALLGYTLGESAWDMAFAAALGEALACHDLPLIGGDTVRLVAGSPRVLGLTLVGAAPAGGAPARSGAKAGDALWVTGTVGDAGAGLALCRTGASEPAELVSAYLRPHPMLAEGQALAPQVAAMMDVSDGVLIDAARMAAASGLAASIAIDALPLSDALIAHAGNDCEARLAAATAGDDYQLLFALPAGENPPVPATRVGAFAEGEGITLSWHGAPLTLPDSLGFAH